REGLIDIKTAVIFGAPSIAAVYLTRKFVVPAIPEQIATFGDVVVTKSLAMMLLFAVLMVVASISMIREKTKTQEQEEGPRKFNYPLILLEGVFVGALTGLVGAGGGFLIIPALVLLSKLPMKMAVGTSLLIIAAKSLIGFTGDLGHFAIDWTMLLTVTALAVVGIFIGNRMSRNVSPDKLKKGFGYLVLIMGIYIIIKELLG
ncbi:MAG TPA: sulfite exporter TauE/SafE family protein, partial [Sphingobacteriaceae bacterium]